VPRDVPKPVVDGLLATIADKKILDDDVKKGLNAALDEFGKQFAATAAAA